MLKYKTTMIQFAQFGLIGVVSLLIDVGVTTFLFNIAHVPAYLASAIGFLSAFFFNFPLNRKKVFKHSKNDRFTLRSQVVMYFALSIFNLVFTSYAVDFTVHTGGIQIYWAKMIFTVIIAIWNFLIFKFLIFSKLSNRDSGHNPQ